jgi:hypothetical protein
MPDFGRLLRDVRQTEDEVRGKAHLPALGLDVDVSASAESDDEDETLDPVFRILSAILGYRDSIREAVAVALFDYYHVCRPYWTTDYGGEERMAELAPRIAEPGQIWPLLRDRYDADRTPALVLTTYKNELDTLGFILDFPCTWDCEHGVAVRVERWQVVRVGVYGSI